MQYIHQLSAWPKFTWNLEKITPLLGNVRNCQGRLLGRMEGFGFSLREEAILQTLTLNIIKNSEIEGESLNPDQVRSSVARKLGMDVAGLIPSDRNVDGVVEMMLDATQNYDKPLTEVRLQSWQSALFPTGYSGLRKIIVGQWRDDHEGPMQVVSGPIGRERVHYEAPVTSRIPEEIRNFLLWFNEDQTIDPVLKAGIAHLWFITVHPFEDGNGRLARAITDMQLARSDGSTERFYSMSVQIRLERNDYYEILEKTQKYSLANSNQGHERIDITGWLEWFLACLDRAILTTEKTLSSVFAKAKFWERYQNETINDRQRKLLNKLLDGFEGKLTSSKWAAIAKCSHDTALRDIQELITKGILIREPAGGRSTSYKLKDQLS